MNKTDLFFYNRIEKDTTDPNNPITTVFRDCFNVNRVIRVANLKNEDEEALVIFLDDIHEEMRQVPITKNGKTIHESRKIPVQTQLIIEDVDSIKKFRDKYDI